MRQIILLMLGLFCLAGHPAEAAIILSEDYEVATMNDLVNTKGWEYICGAFDFPPGSTVPNPVPIDCTQDITTTRVHGGSHALTMTYEVGYTQNTTTEVPGGYARSAKINKALNNLTEIYVRYWVYYEILNPSNPNSGFFPPPSSPVQGGSSKQHYWNPAGGHSFYDLYMYDYNGIMAQSPSATVYGGWGTQFCPGTNDVRDVCSYVPNTSAGQTWTMPYNQWVCVQYHHKLNTPGQTDGIVEVTTVDNAGTRQTVNFQNAVFRLDSGTITQLQIYRQDAYNQRRTEDDFVIATTQAEASCGGAGPSATLFTDDFENHLTPNWDTTACVNVNPGGAPWQDGCGGASSPSADQFPYISTGWAHSGTHSLLSRATCAIGLDVTTSACGSFVERTHAGVQEVWMRWWSNIPAGFQLGPIGVKQLYNKTNDTIGTGSLTFWSLHAGDAGELGAQVIPGDGSGTNYHPNTGNHVNLIGGVHCVETHLSMGTIGTATGTVEAWVDGVQVMSYPNQVLVEVHPGVNFTHITRYDQLGRGDQYMDDLAVGTARFNDCGGAGPVSHTITWDFETGAFPNPATTPTQVPAIVLLEGSPHFHYGRLTASPSDCGTSFFTTCPKTRAEVFFNQLNTTLGETRTYQIDLRMPSSGTGGSNTGTHRNMAWQLFGANGLSSRTIWIGINPANNHWYVANRVQPCNTNCVQNPLDDTPANVQLIDLGAVVYDQWETFKIIVKYATDTTGTVQALKNNTNMGTTSNQATISGVEPMQVYIDQLDVVGNFGIVDFDNLSMTDVQPSGPVKPPPPEGVTIQ